MNKVQHKELIATIAQLKLDHKNVVLENRELQAENKEQAYKIKELNKDLAIQQHARKGWKKEHDRVSRDHYELEKENRELKEQLTFSNSERDDSNLLYDQIEKVNKELQDKIKTMEKIEGYERGEF